MIILFFLTFKELIDDDYNGMSQVMRKPAFCIYQNKAADQLCGKCPADQRLCFHYIYLLPQSETLSLLPSSVVVQPGLCLTLSKTLNTGFSLMQFICLVFADACQMNCCPMNSEPHSVA